MQEPDQKKQRTILVVDDEEDILFMLVSRLQHAGYHVVSTSRSTEAYDLVREVRPDIILTDIMMPGVSGTQLKARLEAEPSTRDIPVIFLTSLSTVSDKVAGLRLGADDYITKPYDKTELLARVEAALNRRDMYRSMSMTDALTGLYNARYYLDEMPKHIYMAKRYHRTFSCAIVDVNRLKLINDTYGHVAGDCAIKAVADILRNELRPVDTVVRYGGDEFVIIFPDTKKESCINALERIKELISRDPIPCEAAGHALSLSVSAGVVEYNDSISDALEMFKLADAAMYADKKEAHEREQ